MGFTGLVLLFVSSGHYREYMCSAGGARLRQAPHSPNSGATVRCLENLHRMCACAAACGSEGQQRLLDEPGW